MPKVVLLFCHLIHPRKLPERLSQFILQNSILMSFNFPERNLLKYKVSISSHYPIQSGHQHDFLFSPSQLLHHFRRSLADWAVTCNVVPSFSVAQFSQPIIKSLIFFIAHCISSVIFPLVALWFSLYQSIQLSRTYRVIPEFLNISSVITFSLERKFEMSRVLSCFLHLSQKHLFNTYFAGIKASYIYFLLRFHASKKTYLPYPQPGWCRRGYWIFILFTFVSRSKSLSHVGFA